MNSKFTIVISTLNRLQLLKRALESALNQTLPVDVIVSDNGSNDGTKEYLAGIEASNLTKLRIEKTISIHEHSEFWFAHIQSEWYVHLSDDDYLEPTFMESISRLLDEHPSAQLIYSKSVIHMWDVAYNGKCGPEIEEGWEFLKAFLEGAREPCMCSIAFKRAFTLQFKMPHNRLIGDMYYWVRAADIGSIVCVQEALSHYTYIRNNIDNQTSGIRLSVWAKESRLLAEEMRSVINNHVHESGWNPDRVVNLFLARTCANQVLWNTLRGGKRFKMIGEVLKESKMWIRSPSVWVRVLGGLLLPGKCIKFGIKYYIKNKEN